MKKQIDFKLIAIFGGGILFTYLFWMENLGLNLLLYSIFIVIALFLDTEIVKTKKLYLYCFSHILASILVVYNHSALNIISYYISLIVFVGFVHAQLIRSVFTSIFSGFLQIVSSPVNLILRIVKVKIGNFSLQPIIKPIKYIIIPIFVLILFSIVYSIANPVFANYLETLFTNIGNFVFDVYTFFFGELSFARFMHVVLGILFTAGILLAFKKNGIQNAELTLTEKLIRKRKNKLIPNFAYEVKDVFIGSLMKKKMALKTENIVGIISFAALNLLLLFLNGIDIYTLWLGNIASNVANLGKSYSAELHEGTNALIVSIVMAMMVILYFFNGNINFFSKNKTIKIIAYIWIIQNAFLVCSVLLRDYNYIDMHGLTYKRIGVIIFLLLCTIGLITVYIKVAKQRTFFYLFKANGIVWYLFLLLFGFVNWDVFIVSYNIENRKSITLDLDHIMDMSDKTLPLLAKNRKLLEQYIPTTYDIYTDTESATIDTAVATVAAQASKNNTIATTPIDTVKLQQEDEKKRIEAFNYNLDERIKRFKTNWKETSWLSFNYRDWQTHKYFMNNKKD